MRGVLRLFYSTVGTSGPELYCTTRILGLKLIKIRSYYFLASKTKQTGQFLPIFPGFSTLCNWICDAEMLALIRLT